MMEEDITPKIFVCSHCMERMPNHIHQGEHSLMQLTLSVEGLGLIFMGYLTNCCQMGNRSKTWDSSLGDAALRPGLH